ncbi:hypothetical protein D3C84_1105590 [compost metagenome]
MASGCLIVGSETAPVREVIRYGENGLLVNFFRPQQITEQVVAALESPQRFSELRQAAYGTAQEYSIAKGNSRYLETFGFVTNEATSDITVHAT